LEFLEVFCLEKIEIVVYPGGNLDSSHDFDRGQISIFDQNFRFLLIFMDQICFDQTAILTKIYDIWAKF